jgi:NTP pyrophosphatase (non-canonical NTP hydrolase)
MPNDKVIGFEDYENIGISLVNVVKCGCCEKLISYNGFPPRVCPHCNQVADQTYLKANQSRDSRQLVVAQWVVKTFGQDSIGRSSRALRLLEEVIELAQAESVSIEVAHRLLDYVYSRPLGKPEKELGQVGQALLAYAESAGFSAEGTEVTEVERVLSLDPEALRKRQSEKVSSGVGLPTNQPPE